MKKLDIHLDKDQKIKLIEILLIVGSILAAFITAPISTFCKSNSKVRGLKNIFDFSSFKVILPPFFTI
jgi:hypothetical protein